jgi:hypothetical protein
LGEGYFRDKDIGKMVKKEKNGFETKKRGNTGQHQGGMQ